MSGPSLPDGTIEWMLEGGLKGVSRWRNYFHLFAPAAGVPDGNDLAAIHGPLSTFALFFWGSVASSDATLHLSRLTYKGSSGEVRDDALIDAPGSNTAMDILAAAACFTWHVPESGRGVFGRTFIAGLPKDSYIDGAYITDPPGSGWQSNANSFRANVNATHTAMFPVVTLSLVRRHSAGVPLPVARLDPIVSVRLSSRVATQVRRLKNAEII